MPPRSVPCDDGGGPGAIRPPHERDRPAVTSVRGSFFLPGDVVEEDGHRVQTGSSSVEWERAPGAVRPFPVVLVHGGGGQASDWRDTPDGRPGWMDGLVSAGFVVYNVDRPGHGRSSRLVSGGDDVLPPLDYDVARRLWADPAVSAQQTQWVWPRHEGSPFIDQLVASAGRMRRDAVRSEALDGRRLADLLDLIGPSIVITHSAGAPAGWLAAAERPGLVVAIVAIEPLGPPWGDLPGTGGLAWGLTHAPLPHEPPVADPADLHDGQARVVPGLAGLPIAVVSGETSRIGRHAGAVAEHLRSVGAAAQHLDLPGLGIRGNGHGPMFELNSDRVLQVVVAWLDGALPAISAISGPIDGSSP